MKPFGTCAPTLRRASGQILRSAVLGTNYADLIAGAVQSDSFEPSFTGGGGIGYVWSAYFRTDMTVDVHSLMNTEFTGNHALRNR